MKTSTKHQIHQQGSISSIYISNNLFFPKAEKPPTLHSSALLCMFKSFTSQLCLSKSNLTTLLIHITGSLSKKSSPLILLSHPPHSHPSLALHVQTNSEYHGFHSSSPQLNPSAISRILSPLYVSSLLISSLSWPIACSFYIQKFISFWCKMDGRSVMPHYEENNPGTKNRKHRYTETEHTHVHELSSQQEKFLSSSLHPCLLLILKSENMKKEIKNRKEKGMKSQQSGK